MTVSKIYLLYFTFHTGTLFRFINITLIGQDLGTEGVLGSEPKP